MTCEASHEQPSRKCKLLTMNENPTNSTLCFAVEKIKIQAKKTSSQLQIYFTVELPQEHCI